MVIQNAILVATQVLILFILIAVGFTARKVKMIDDNGQYQMTNILLMIVTPAMIVKSFQIPFETALLNGLLIAAASAVMTHIVGAVLAMIVFRRQPAAKGRVLKFAVVFVNCGFMCIPLLNAVLGTRGVFFGSIYIAVYYILLWTYGVILMTGQGKDISFFKALFNPSLVAIMIGLPLFLLGIKIPAVPAAVINFLGSINSPLAMIIIGGQIAGLSLATLFKVRQVYVISLLRLLIVPAVIMLGLHIFPLNRELIIACLIPAAAPAAVATALFATRYGQDKELAAQAVALTTIFSIITIPLMIMLSDLIGGSLL